AGQARLNVLEELSVADQLTEFDHHLGERGEERGIDQTHRRSELPPGEQYEDRDRSDEDTGQRPSDSTGHAHASGDAPGAAGASSTDFDLLLGYRGSAHAGDPSLNVRARTTSSCSSVQTLCR